MEIAVADDTAVGRARGKLLGRPVKWTETRSEDMVATHHGRDQIQDLELAATKDGTLLGMKVTLLANMGAYLQIITPGTPLLGMFMFSLFSLVYIGLFPSVVRLNLDISPASTTYRWLYAVWGAGAFFGAISVGTFLSRVDRKVLIVRGFIGFGIALGVFSQLRHPPLAFPVGFVLGFFYFMTATAITTTLQLNMKNTERATVMPLWFMVFGGTVPIGNLLFGVVIEWVGARAVLGFGAAFAFSASTAALPASSACSKACVTI